VNSPLKAKQGVNANIAQCSVTVWRKKTAKELEKLRHIQQELGIKEGSVGVQIEQQLNKK
jgi:hypothetical protein